MTKSTESKQRKSFTLKVTLDPKAEFKGDLAALLFDKAGNVLEHARIRNGVASFSHSDRVVAANRLFIAPETGSDNEETEKPSIRMMERLSAYEPVLMQNGKIVDAITIPASIIKFWPLCLCVVRGQVIKSDSGLPVCGARVHICEVDKFWRWIFRLPDFEVFRFRDDLLRVFEKPELWRPPFPEPDPSPFAALKKGLVNLRSINPQPEPPGAPRLSARNSRAISLSADSVQAMARTSAIPAEVLSSLNTASAQAVRNALITNFTTLYPWLCLILPWWRYRCDEIAVLETDALGRFQTFIFYSCLGDKPDLYFWVEYEIGGVMETIYKPALACHTYWNYECGKEVIIHISDDRVPACNNGPDLPGCAVQILSIGRQVSMSEIRGPGALVATEGLTTGNEPFGGKLEPRVWFSRTRLRDDKNIHYYRWSYRRLTEGDGTVLPAPGPWTHLTRTVVRHYAVPVPGGFAHVPLTMGPQNVGGEANLFEIRPLPVPPGGIEWTVVDEREDLASAHFETDRLGNGDNACEKAFNAAGKYELKLELFKNNGALVDWTAEGIDLQITDVPAPFGAGIVTATNAPDYYRIKNAAGHTVAFRMVLRIDNNCCSAEVNPVSGAGLHTTPCGFIEFDPGASATLSFKANHPNGFATFSFSVVRGVSTTITEASAYGEVHDLSVNTLNPALPAHAYTKPAVTSSYTESFGVGELLDGCARAAFSEALHAWTRATDGYGRLWHLDAFDHDAFALTPTP
ncbi:MAG: hypothetical protein JW764_03145 [Chlorobiaceae bacterium]|nr:hypothetical protein [Chlorobiaceae bacterium]